MVKASTIIKIKILTQAGGLLAKNMAKAPTFSILQDKG